MGALRALLKLEIAQEERGLLKRKRSLTKEVDSDVDQRPTSRLRDTELL